MALLRKLKSSTLMETMVATVLIVVLFLMSSMILNTVFGNSIKNDSQNLSARVNELEYQYHNGLIALPYFETFNDWEINLNVENTGNEELLSVEVVNLKTKKEVNTIEAIDEEIQP